MEQPPVLPDPPKRPPGEANQSTTSCLVIGLILSVVALLAIVIIAFLLPALSRAPKAAQRATCQNNLKQIGLVCKMYANEQPDGRYPPLSSAPGRLMFEGESVYLEYLTDLTILVCPAVDVDHDDWDAKGQAHRFFDDHSYFYFGHLVRNEEEMLSFVDAYRAAVEAGDDVSGELVTPDGQVFPRLSENLGLALLEQRQIPIMFDGVSLVEQGLGPRSFHHVPGGCNVLFMDGHVEFMKYPGKWPMTERSLTALASIAGMVSPIVDAGPKRPMPAPRTVTGQQEVETAVASLDSEDSDLKPLKGDGGVTPVEMATVPAGSFEMGDPWDEGRDIELPVHTIMLSAYQIGKYEVTNQEYADVLNWANGRGYLTHASSNTVRAYGRELIRVGAPYCQIAYLGSEFVVESRDGYSMASHPVVGVTWCGAAAYCNWLSERHGLQPCYDTRTWACDFSSDAYRLPTEAEWERAASWDGSRRWRYSTSSDSMRAGDANYGKTNPLGLSISPYTCPVGSYPGVTSPVGCYDMAGNVYEWCHDWYGSDYYANSTATDPVGPSSGSGHVKRGGGWHGGVNGCRASDRHANRSGYAGSVLGFRLAR
jgi:prepilin-type processing-associated H-X9-DG protein